MSFLPVRHAKPCCPPKLECLLVPLQISAEEFAAAQSDPVAHFAAPIAQHMNADHADSILAMLRHYIGIDVQSSSIQTLDR